MNPTAKQLTTGGIGASLAVLFMSYVPTPETWGDATVAAVTGAWTVVFQTFMPTVLQKLGIQK